MNLTNLARICDKLSSLSVSAAHDPAQFDWPASIAPGEWCFTPELVSLFDTPLWHALDEAQQRCLAFHEAVNFFSLNVHGELQLIRELEQRASQAGNPSLATYLQHFVAEERNHIRYFTGFCDRYAQGLFPDRCVALGDKDPEEPLASLLVFARINLFEEIADHYNRTMARDPRLAPVVREINRIHHVEEMRHLAFGRRYVSALLRSVCGRDQALQAAVREHLDAYLAYVWKQYYSIDAYAAAGLADPMGAWQVAASMPAPVRHRQRVNAVRLGSLRRLHLVTL